VYFQLSIVDQQLQLLPTMLRAGLKSQVIKLLVLVLICHTSMMYQLKLLLVKLIQVKQLVKLNRLIIDAITKNILIPYAILDQKVF
jgi:hypothetical protein